MRTDENFEKTLFTESQIDKKVKKAAKILDGKFKGKTPLAVCVLKGAAMFFCDLVRVMETPLELAFITVSSYGSSTKSSGNAEILSGVTADIRGRDIILIEDIVDSGNTLSALEKLFIESGANSFTAVTLLDKPSRRAVNVKLFYSCFTVGDEFVVGYGMDYAQRYRDLPYIAVLKREVYE